LQIYCFECRDYIYDGSFDLAVRAEKAHQISNKLEACEPDSKRVRFQMWNPTQKDQVALQQAQKISGSAHLLGLRGLLNLGSTCFLSTVMQAGFVHNPVMRNYFLSDQHNARFCKESSCITCQVDSFFTEMFSCKQEPFAPHELLCLIWKNSALFSYEQQDAHEFFISILGGLHDKSMSGPCHCIGHMCFGSMLRSNVTCSLCSFVSSSFDPALDLSLEIPEDFRGGGPLPSLHDCLRGFTHPEVLGSDDQLKCAKCGSMQQSRKQMSIERPPVVLALQIKRFQRTMKTNRKMTSSKVETRVTFPAELDISSYLSATIINGPPAKKENANYKPPAHSPLSFTYDLFSVVNHQGSLDNGHYTSYVLQQLSQGQTEWIKCDDATLTRVPASEVFSSQAYLLFYIKRYLEFETKSPPAK
jgi:ubiquitin carboxyl-terminal hydrolase 22/27/51